MDQNTQPPTPSPSYRVERTGEDSWTIAGQPCQSIAEAVKACDAQDAARGCSWDPSMCGMAKDGLEALKIGEGMDVTPEPDEADEPEAPTFDHQATYSPEDDKLRLYFAFRIPRPEWDRLRGHGWAWCMKQAEAGGCDMSAPWSAQREDDALALAGEIGDEDQPRAERSAERAERFEGYGDKREGEAVALANRYDAGPSIHANQSEARANRSAARHDRIAGHAVNQWSKAEYWTRRTAGVISHALYLDRAEVRHRRIKGLEADQRRVTKQYEESAARWDAWSQCATLLDPDAWACAYNIANAASSWGEYDHPRTPGVRSSLWSMLADDRPERHITGREAAALYLAAHPKRPELAHDREWNHPGLRIAYEKQMLAAQGGTAADCVEMIAGGFIGKLQIQKVTKDRAGRVSKLYFYGEMSASYDRNGKAYGEDNPRPLTLHDYPAEKVKPGSYRAPTADELAAFQAAKKEAAKGKPKGPPLINPTPEAAQALQAHWNEQHAARILKAYGANRLPEAVQVVELTQAQYTARSAGTYGPCKTLDLCADWSEYHWRTDKPKAFRVRVMGSGVLYGPDRVVIVTDKAQAAMPARVAAEQPAVALVAAV